MNGIVVLLFIIIQYFFLLYSLYRRNRTLFIVAYIIHIYFYDFTFINASYYLPDLMVNLLKPFTEYLFVVLTVLVIFKLSKKEKIVLRGIDKLTVYYLIVPSIIVLILNDFSKNINFVDTVSGIRTYLLPVIIPFFLYKLGWMASVKYKAIIYTLFYVSFITIAFGYYQRLTFNGNVSSLWFADFFKKFKVDPVAEAPYDFIRNDVLRVTSFFVSPINYSIAIAIPAVFALNILFDKKGNYSKFFIGMVLATSLFGLFIAETRIGLFIFLIGFILTVFTRLIKNKFLYASMFVVPLLFIITSFSFLLFGYTDDLSALGRLIQYQNFFSNFSLTGLGFNDTYVLTYFDSFYISIGLVFGILAIFPMMFFIFLAKRLYNLVGHLGINSDFFLKSCLIIALTFLYSYAFQFTAGAYHYRLIFILIFVVFSKYKTHADFKEANSGGNIQL